MTPKEVLAAIYLNTEGNWEKTCEAIKSYDIKGIEEKKKDVAKFLSEHKVLTLTEPKEFPDWITRITRPPFLLVTNGDTELIYAKRMVLVEGPGKASVFARKYPDTVFMYVDGETIVFIQSIKGEDGEDESRGFKTLRVKEDPSIIDERAMQFAQILIYTSGETLKPEKVADIIVGNKGRLEEVFAIPAASGSVSNAEIKAGRAKFIDSTEDIEEALDKIKE